MNKGFTLIELLIVVTIIAILAGAAIPYVQEYIEDARISRCKADLTEIKNALIRYELDKGKAWPAAETTITRLVGPYLAKALIDPWGSPYYIDGVSSVVISNGPNRTRDSANGVLGDDIAVAFRPPVAMTKAYWIDVDNSGTVSSGDQLKLNFSRPVSTDGWDGTAFSLDLNNSTVALAAGDIFYSNEDGYKSVTVNYTTNGAFVPGRDSIFADATGVVILDLAVGPFGPTTCNPNLVTIQAQQ